jgi:AbiV family abortive infection protein
MTEDEKQIIESKNVSYYLIAKEEIYNGMTMCNQNSKVLFNSASVIAENGEGYYGAANSLMILSSEECIKGLVLTSIYCDVQVPFEIEPLFYSHPAKHIQGKDLQKHITIVSSIISVVRTFIAKKSSRKQMLGEVLDAVSLYFNSEQHKKWWDSANQTKNKGFYTDIKQSKFKSPAEISKDQFLESKNLVKMFIKLLSNVEKLKADDYKRLNI